MNGALAWLLFMALYCFAVQRWTRDFRRHLEPPLRRKAEQTLGSRVTPWLSVLVTAFVVFAPVGGLFLAAHFGVIPWHRAGMLLGLTLMISCVTWLVPGREERGAR